MKLGIMQPYFFPYAGYFQLINAVDKFIVYEHVSFRKRSWITRNRLLRKGSGTPYFINIPVNKSSSNRTIRDMSISNDTSWRKQLCKSIYFDYRQAPFFDMLYPLICNWLNKDVENLHKLNALLIKEICQLLTIETIIQSENGQFLDMEEALVSTNRDSHINVKTSRIIDICRKENASTYINPIGGTELYDKKTFDTEGIELLFLQPDTPAPYGQFRHNFVSHLSIIDELMHKGPEQTFQDLNRFSFI